MKSIMYRVIKCSLFLYAFLLLLYIVDNVKASDESTEIILGNENTSVYINVERYVRNVRNWFYDNLPYLRQEVGRCFSAGIRKLQFTFLPIFYKLGVIGTMLVFLTLISLKGLTVGVIILILSLSNYLAKLYVAKHVAASGENIKNLHVHIHPGHGHDYHHDDDYHYSYHRSDHKPMTYSNYYREEHHPYSQQFLNPSDKNEEIAESPASGVVNANSGYFLNFLRGSNLKQ